MDIRNTTDSTEDVRDAPVASVSEVTTIPEGVLVEILPGLLAAYGDIDLANVEGAEVLDISVAGMPGLDVVARAVTGAGILVQGSHAAMSARGLVRLAPQTLQALKTAQPLVKDGWYLGTLTSGGGKLAHSVRWLPATGAQAATVLTGLGPAVALFAVSAQVSALSLSMKRLEGKVDALYAELSARDWDDLMVILEDVIKAEQEVHRCGFEDPATRDKIKELNSSDLGKMYQRALRKTREHHANHTQSTSVLVENHNQIVSDIRALVEASKARHLVDLMRIGALVAEGGSENALAHRVEKFKDDLQKRHDEVTNAVLPVRARAHLTLLGSENPDGIRAVATQMTSRAQDTKAKIFPRRKGDQQARPSLRDVVQEIDHEIEAFVSERVAVPERPVPAVCDGDTGVIDRIREALRWSLPQDEPLLALVSIERRSEYLAVTTTRWTRVSLRGLVAGSGIDDAEPLENIRYVLDAESKGSQRRLSVVMRDKIVPVEFKRVEKGSSRAETIDRLVSLLQTAMNLPEDERGKDPLLLENQSGAMSRPQGIPELTGAVPGDV